MMPNARLFITGTDTGIGKTLTSALLFSAFRQAGFPIGYWKPIQTGEDSDRETVRQLLPHAPDDSFPPTLNHFPAPMAPARAAARIGRRISMHGLVHESRRLQERTWIIEGAGGILVPIAPQVTMRDLMEQINGRILLVASPRLGTINQIFLSLEALDRVNRAPAGLILNGDGDPDLERFLQEWGLRFPIVRIPRLLGVSSRVIHEAASRVFPTSFLEKLLHD